MAGVLLVASCGTAPRMQPARTALARDPLELPVVWNGGQALARVSVNGTGPFLFLLDTGSWQVHVTPDVAQRIGVSPPQDGVHLDRVDVGGFRIEGLDANVLRLDEMSGSAGVRIDGVLGMAVFQRVLLTFDYPARCVLVGTGALPAPDGVGILATETDAPEVRLTLGGVEQRAMLDTGARLGLNLPEEVAARLEFTSAPRPVARVATFGGVSDEVRFGRLAGAVRLGAVEFVEPIVVVLGKGQTIVGTDLLRHFRVTFDAAHRRVRLEPKATAPIRTPPYRGIGAGIFRSAGRWRVAYTMAGGAAEKAGLREGDDIVRIEGRAVQELTADDYRGLLRTRDTLAFEIRRGSDVRRVDVPVVVLVP